MTAVLVSGCGNAFAPVTTGDDDGAAAATDPAPATPGPRLGGTLRVGLPAEGDNGAITDLYIDPATWFSMDELMRCCLLRTLLSYNGRTTADGGIILRPDLAESPPEVSADGRTWTFRLRGGLRYAPPYQDTEITSRDIVRGLERSIALNGGVFYASVTGVGAYRDGTASTIAGFETPDDRTLVVRLDSANADIATAMALPYAAPVPEGATDGHEDDYGHYLVASGPYMYEGSTDLQKGGAGPSLSGRYGRDVAVLVRNPSWDRTTDPLRGAWVDRIELSRSASLPDDRARLERGEIDVPGYAVEPDELETLEAASPSRIAFASFPRLTFLPFNLALPPFDDVEVRKAVNLAINRAAIVATHPDDIGTTIRVARHAIPDSLENNLLLDYDPYPSVGDKGDLVRAREAMARSGYDDDGDGMCDAPACRGVPIVVRDGHESAASIVTRNLAPLGIEVVVRTDGVDPYDVRAHNGTFVLSRWGADTPALGGYIAPFFEGPVADGQWFGSASATLIGSTPNQLAEWGYTTTQVPSVDDKVAECLAVTGSRRFVCAAELDQLVMEQAVAMVPIAFPEVGFLYGERVASYSIDQSVVAPALDQIAVHP